MVQEKENKTEAPVDDVEQFFQNLQKEQSEKFYPGQEGQEEGGDTSEDDKKKQEEQPKTGEEKVDEKLPEDKDKEEEQKPGEEAGKAEEGKKEEEPETNQQPDVEITPEKQIEIFNKLTGLEATSIDEVKEHSGILNKWPEYKKHLDLYPTLVEKLKASQDVMSYFPDEQTYKVAQLVKEGKYEGKKAELTKVLETDIKDLSDIEIVKLYAGLNAPAGVKNPFRYTVRKIGLDPDEVSDGFNDLNDDDKDLFYGLAAQAKGELADIGKDIEVPESNKDEIETLLQQEADSLKDDLEKKRSDVAPVARSVVDEVKEFQVDDNFSFKLDLNEEDKKEYSDFLTDAILSGDFNVSTDEGKQDLYNALLDEIWVDNRKKILKAYDADLRTRLEKEFREKYDNETPLKKETPKPEKQESKKSGLVNVIEGMVNETG